MIQKKNILFLVVFIITSLTFYAKTDYNKTIQSEKDQNRLSRLENRIKKLEKSNDSLREYLKLRDGQFQLYRVLLEKYDNNHTSLLTEFSIFVAIFVVIFGSIGYFAGLKPAQDSKKEVDGLLEKLQSNIDELFSDYLTRNRDSLINKYLDIIINKNESELSNAIHYLDSVKPEGFNSEQLFKMRKIVLEDDYNFTHQIFTDMIFTKDDIVEDTCKEALKAQNHSIIAYALIYFAEHNIHKYDQMIIEYLNSVPNELGVL